MARKGATSWLGWPTQRLLNFCPRSPQEPQTRSRPAWLACLHGTIPSRVGVDVLPFLPPPCSIQTPTRQRTLPSHYVSSRLRFFPLLWWRGAVTSSTNKPIRDHCNNSSLCFLLNCVADIAVSQSRGREKGFPPLSARYLYRSSCNLPCVSPTPLPPLSPYHTMIPYCDTILL